jgi:hypothetical protein
MKRIPMLLLIAVCASCGPTPEPAPAPEPALADDVDLDAGTIAIDIGRNDVITDAILDLAHQTPGKPSAYPQSTAAMNSMLRAEVWKYNHTRASVCLYGYLPEHSCGAPYLPEWIHESEETAPSLAVIHARANELSTRVVALWDAACEEAKPRLKHEDWFPHCSIE